MTGVMIVLTLYVADWRWQGWWLCWYYLWLTDDDRGDDCVDIICDWLEMTGVMIVLILLVADWRWQGRWLCWHYSWVTDDDEVMMIVLIFFVLTDRDDVDIICGWLMMTRWWWLYWHYLVMIVLTLFVADGWWLCRHYLRVTNDDGGDDYVDIICGWLMMTGMMIVLTLFCGWLIDIIWQDRVDDCDDCVDIIVLVNQRAVTG